MVRAVVVVVAAVVAAVAMAMPATGTVVALQDAYASSEPFQYIDRTVKIQNGTAGAPLLDGRDAFGASVDIIGDVDGNGVQDIMVGATGDDSYAEDAGAVYILFLNADGTVKDTAKITGASGLPLAEGDYFGAAVAGIGDLDGDGVPDAAVGADGDDAGGDITNAGAVHILFLNADGTVKAATELSAATVSGLDTKHYEYFGFRVTDAGDVDGDGTTDIAVGKYPGFGSKLFLSLPFDPVDDHDEILEMHPDEMFYGSVDILFMNADGTAKGTARIDQATENGPGIGPAYYFGTAVAGIGDFDGDGVPDLVAGADFTDSTRSKMCRGGSSASTTVPNTGSMYVLLMNADGSVKESFTIDGNTVNGPNLEAYEFFGIAASSVGDVDGDGVTDLIGGANRGNGGGLIRGEAHVMFMNADGSVKMTQTLDDAAPNGPDTGDYNYFGFAISSAADIDADGNLDIVIGAYLDNISGVYDQTVEGASTLTAEERERFLTEFADREARPGSGAIHIIFTR